VLRILVTNDDGIDSDGLAALAERMSHLGEVMVVAPDGNRSTAAHSMTLERPLRMTLVKKDWYAVDGTPSDCVHLALNGMLREHRPELVACGINKGGNLGQDITYSGTVMAALEATIIGVPAFAVSIDARVDFEYSGASMVADKVARYILTHGLPPDTLLNVNVPNVAADQLKGIVATVQGRRLYGDEIEENVDPRGKKYYWIAGQEMGFVDIEGSDIMSVRDGYASVTPIHFILTDYVTFEKLKNVLW
jgi:5'-nucleotidase